MGKKHRKLRRTNQAKPTTSLERVVLDFMATVRQAHRDEVAMARDTGRWVGHLTEKVIDAAFEEARHKRTSSGARKGGVN